MKNVLVGVALVIGCNAPETGSLSRAEIVPVEAGTEEAITLGPDPITIVGAATLEATGSGSVTGSGVMELTGVSLTDANVPPAFRFVAPACATPACTFMPGIPLPAQLTIACTPSATPRFGSVTVLGPNGTTDTASLECLETATTADLAVPDPAPLSAQVGSTATTELSATNTGNVALDLSLQLAPGEWSPAMCVAPASCRVAVGATLVIPLEFTPTEHGNRTTTLQVDSVPDAGTKFATLEGTGLGGVLRVDEPETFVHNFGTIAKGQLATFTVAMTNTGNQPITVTPSALAAPLLVQPDPVSIAANGTGMFDVSCQSDVPGGPFAMAVMLEQSENTYERNTSTIDFTCTIANTTVQVTPNPIELGDLRAGDPAKSITVTVENPAGGGAVTIERIALRGNPATLVLLPPSSPLPAMLPDASSLTTTLELATTEDVTLEGVVLEVELTEDETVVLEIPVTGEVGSPRAVIVPDELALGTVCVGTPVMGTVTMTNTGTLTLAMLRPEMSSTSFNPLFTNPTSYPEPPGTVPLLEQDSATVGVMPTTLDAGRIEGTLVWDVNVPLAPFRIPVAVEYLASGTAVSPEVMQFGSIELGAQSARQVVTLENCGADPVVVTFGGVRAREGRGASWVLEPPGDQRTLNPDGTMRIMVTFAPQEPGRHRANIVFDVDGVERVVALDGDGLGETVEKTSFYACTCSGSGTPAHGWPIVAGIAFVLGRRRRRC